MWSEHGDTSLYIHMKISKIKNLIYYLNCISNQWFIHNATSIHHTIYFSSVWKMKKEIYALNYLKDHGSFVCVYTYIYTYAFVLTLCANTSGAICLHKHTHMHTHSLSMTWSTLSLIYMSPKNLPDLL